MFILYKLQQQQLPDHYVKHETKDISQLSLLQPSDMKFI